VVGVASAEAGAEVEAALRRGQPVRGSLAGLVALDGDVERAVDVEPQVVAVADREAAERLRNLEALWR
jgi:hypothetical protein